MGKLVGQLKDIGLDAQEWGNAFDAVAPKDDIMMHALYGTVLSDFWKTKKESFPYWDGLPEIKVRANLDGSFSIAWYALVPSDTVEDDSELWNQ